MQAVSAAKNYNWDGKNKMEQQWTFTGAMLYSVTVITTIGSFISHLPQTPRRLDYHASSGAMRGAGHSRPVNDGQRAFFSEVMKMNVIEANGPQK